MSFHYGQVLTRQDICNRHKEIAILQRVINNRNRIVVYGRRRFGKTSILRSIIYQDFIDSDKKAIALFIDFYQVDSIEDATNRIKTAMQQAFSKHLVSKNLWQKLINYLTGIRVNISVDPMTGKSSVELAFQQKNADNNMEQIFSVLTDISLKYPTLIICDEFQDIINVSGLEAKLRQHFQLLNRTPIILSGSKRHVLHEMLSDENRPFYGFGSDLELGPIDIEDWYPYIKQRFKTNKISISLTATKELIESVDNVPNAVQELCQWIYDTRAKQTIENSDIYLAIDDLLTAKSSRFLERMVSLKNKERKLLIAIAKHQPVGQINAATFVAFTGMSASGIQKATERFYNHGTIDLTSEGYVLVDSLFRRFLVSQAM